MRNDYSRELEREIDGFEELPELTYKTVVNKDMLEVIRVLEKNDKDFLVKNGENTP